MNINTFLDQAKRGIEELHNYNLKPTAILLNTNTLLSMMEAPPLLHFLRGMTIRETCQKIEFYCRLPIYASPGVQLGIVYIPTTPVDELMTMDSVRRAGRIRQPGRPRRMKCPACTADMRTW